jgi:predicted SnoaL-like aldol condensation-catalyzing enzyme
MSSTEHKRIVHEFLDETYNKGNLKNTDRYVTPDFIYHARGEDIEGIEAYVAQILLSTTTHACVRLFLVHDSLVRS